MARASKYAAALTGRLWCALARPAGYLNTLSGWPLSLIWNRKKPLVRTSETGSLFEHAQRLASEFDLELKEGFVGGGSDGNFIAAHGVPVLDGLGVDGAGAHAEHEHIIISDIPRRAALLARLIETI